MLRRIMAYALGLGLPILVFLAPLQVLWHGAPGTEELVLQKVDGRPSLPVRVLTLEDLGALPPRLRLAFQQALTGGSSSVPIDASIGHALEQLHLAAGFAVALDGDVLVLHVVEHSLTVGQWLVRSAEGASCWLAARTGGGCAAA